MERRWAWCTTGLTSNYAFFTNSRTEFLIFHLAFAWLLQVRIPGPFQLHCKMVGWVPLPKHRMAECLERRPYWKTWGTFTSLCLLVPTGCDRDHECIENAALWLTGCLYPSPKDGESMVAVNIHISPEPVLDQDVHLQTYRPEVYKPQGLSVGRDQYYV